MALRKTLLPSLRAKDLRYLWNANPFSTYARPERVWIDGALMYFSGNPRMRPVSDFELGQPGEGDVK